MSQELRLCLSCTYCTFSLIHNSDNCTKNPTYSKLPKQYGKYQAEIIRKLYSVLLFFQTELFSQSGYMVARISKAGTGSYLANLQTTQLEKVFFSHIVVSHNSDPVIKQFLWLQKKTQFSTSAFSVTILCSLTSGTI